MNLGSLSVKELRDEAGKLSIKGRYSMNKEELIEALRLALSTEGGRFVLSDRIRTNIGKIQFAYIEYSGHRQNMYGYISIKVRNVSEINGEAFVAKVCREMEKIDFENVTYVPLKCSDYDNYNNTYTDMITYEKNLEMRNQRNHVNRMMQKSINKLSPRKKRKFKGFRMNKTIETLFAIIFLFTCLMLMSYVFYITYATQFEWVM